jgi:hypothetical protein
MDKALLTHLQLAESLVQQAQEQVDQQVRLIARLRREKRDTTQAEKLLEIFQASLAGHIKDRDRLRKTLRRS